MNSNIKLILDLNRTTGASRRLCRLFDTKIETHKKTFKKPLSEVKLFTSDLFKCIGIQRWTFTTNIFTILAEDRRTQNDWKKIQNKSCTSKVSKRIIMTLKSTFFHVSRAPRRVRVVWNASLVYFERFEFVFFFWKIKAFFKYSRMSQHHVINLIGMNTQKELMRQNPLWTKLTIQGKFFFFFQNLFRSDDYPI